MLTVRRHSRPLPGHSQKIIHLAENSQIARPTKVSQALEIDPAHENSWWTLSPHVPTASWPGTVRKHPPHVVRLWTERAPATGPQPSLPRWRPAPRPPVTTPCGLGVRIPSSAAGPPTHHVAFRAWLAIRSRHTLDDSEMKGTENSQSSTENAARRGLSPGRRLAEDGTAPGNARKSDPKESLDRLGVNGAARPQHPVHSPAFSESRARGWPWGSHSPYCPPTEPRQKELRQKHGLLPPSRMFQDAAGGGQCFPGRSRASWLPFRTAQAVCGKGTKPVAAEVQGQEFPLWLRD